MTVVQRITGSSSAERFPRKLAVAVVVSFALAAAIANLWMALTAGILFVALRALMVHRIDGITGDSEEAMVELVEAATLVVASLMR